MIVSDEVEVIGRVKVRQVLTYLYAELCQRSIFDKFHCEGCEQNWPSQRDHECCIRSEEDIFDSYYVDSGSGAKRLKRKAPKHLFKQVDLFLNGIQVIQSTGTYSYKSTLETLLNYGPAAKKSLLTGGLYYKDTAGAMDSVLQLEPTQDSKHANKFTQKSYIVDLFGGLHCDMLFSDRLLLNHVNVTIKLTPNTPAFALMSGEASPNYKIVIQNAVLKVRTVKVSPVLQLQHLNELKKGANAKYPIRRVDCKTYTIPLGNPSIHKSDLFNGLVPKRVVVAMVDSDSFNGSYTKNPFAFKLYQANSVTLTIDGEMIPFQPITLKLTQAKETNFMEAYQSLFSGTGRLFADSGIDIGRGDYNKGYGILVFDLTPDLCGSSNHFNQKQKGNVSLEIQFTTGLPNAVNLIVYGEFESIVEIDYSRHVTFDYSA
ncbi:hypothetical protein QZH41_003069 [Actinostola sp. cb2023]|nr:hypothetical protein QZH41_003069 [Actinostola sp. cb2023]